MITIDTTSSIPKYKQIIFSIEKAILLHKLVINEKLPSINKICLRHNLSRDTVLLAYNELKKRGVIYAILGKGYFIKSTDFKSEQRIFLLFDELNAFKEEIYNSFLDTINDKANVDIFFHHFNREVFTKLIQDSIGNYSKYIIMPSNLEHTTEIINKLPLDETYILDQTRDDLKKYPAVYQNFVKDIYTALEKGLKRLKKYKKLVLIFPGKKEPIGMVLGFESFCTTFHFEYEIKSEFKVDSLQKGDVYILPNDRDLVTIIENAALSKLAIGKDIGLISYNDTPLKKVVAKGITTISTNFSEMGIRLAEMILNNTKEKIENESQLILRKSL
jgi:DNA-binding transcriptional regulator YhcF (GntR family)